MRGIPLDAIQKLAHIVIIYLFLSDASISMIRMNHWRKSMNLLGQGSNFHPNIKLVRQIETTALSFDVLVENKNDTLLIFIYHKEAAKPHLVPSKSDHPRHILMRAIRYSSTLSEAHHW